jgi:hypothetical protein
VTAWQCAACDTVNDVAQRECIVCQRPSPVPPPAPPPSDPPAPRVRTPSVPQVLPWHRPGRTWGVLDVAALILILLTLLGVAAAVIRSL